MNAINPFKNETYQTSQRPPMLRGYVTMQVRNLMLRNPGLSENSARDFVIKHIEARREEPMVDVVVHPDQGRSERKTMTLTSHVTKNLAQNIIAPSGTAYVLPTVRESFLKISIDAKLKERKVYKGIMLQAKAAGDAVKTNTYNLLQSSTKIFVNSAPGAMNSRFNILYDKPGFNSITSISRHSVKTGYAHTERLIAGNIYLTNLDEVQAYCLRLSEVMPSDIGETIHRFKLYIPTIEEVTEHFVSCVAHYMLVPPRDAIRKFVSLFSPEERTFFLYAGSIKTLFGYNSAVFKRFLENFFIKDYVVPEGIQLDDIKSIDEMLLAMITSLYYEMYGRNAKGNWRNLSEAAKENPQSILKTIVIARHMEAMFAEYSRVFQTFIKVEHDFANTGSYQNLVRKCVIISDTDSVIFTTQDLVAWRCGKMMFTPEAYEMNAFSVYVIQKSLEHVFARLSCGFGMIGKDIYRIAMKNEFLYPAMMRTTIRKHYIGIILIQEGKLLPKPTNDTKGLQFRSSVLSSDTTKRAEEFNVGILQEYINTGEVSSTRLLNEVADFEAGLYKSLAGGERDYLQLVSVKTAENYADPSKTSYFYYEMWQQVFAPKFGVMEIPSKTYKLPLIGKGKVLTHPQFLNRLRAYDQDTHDRLLQFLKDNPTKSPSMLLIPSTLTTVPEILRQIIDIRGIIYANASPFYLGLSALGFAYNFKNGKYIVSDFFNPHGIEVAFSS